MYIGPSDSYQKQKINLTQLRRNTSSRPQKKSGKKAPRKAWEIMKWFVPQNQNSFYMLCQLVTSLRIVTIEVIKGADLGSCDFFNFNFVGTIRYYHEFFPL